MALLQTLPRNRILTYGATAFRRMRKVVTPSIMGTITHVETREPVAALTFDDGPHPEFTPLLLDVLKRYGAHATFFMLGEAAEKYPDVVRQVGEAGHAIGNHSWDHPSFPLLRGRDRRAQILACASAIAPFGSQRLFRPPYGHQSLASRYDAWRLGYRVVTWNVVAEDWCDRDAEWMAARLVSRIKPGSIVILHDAIYRSIQVVPQHDRQRMLTAVDLALKELGDRFRFVTVPELLRYGRPRRRSWYRKADPKMLPLLRKHPLAAWKLTGLRGSTP